MVTSQSQILFAMSLRYSAIDNVMFICCENTL